MGLMPLAVVLGLAVGVLTGGRPRHLGERSFHLGPVLVVGLALQVSAELGLLGDRGHWLVVASYAALVAFAVANLRLAGMGVVLVGMAMNLATVAVNGGMPVDDRAVLAAGLAEDAAEIDDIDFRAKRHRMTGDDTLYWLSDIIPARLLGTGQVLSFGDLVMCAGVVSLLANLLHPFPRRRGRSGRVRLDADAPPLPPAAIEGDDLADPQDEAGVSLWPMADADAEFVDLRSLEPYRAAAVPGDRRRA